MCVRERPMIWLAMTMQIASFPKISRKSFIRCYWKYCSNFPLISTPLNEYFCLKTELQRSLLTSPKPRAARQITRYDWPLYVITSEDISTIRGHKSNGTTSLLFSTRPKPVSCFRPESNLLPVFYPTQTFLKQTNKKGKQTSRHTNQKEKYTILTQGFKQPLIRQLHRKNYYERQMSKQTWLGGKFLW